MARRKRTKPAKRVKDKSQTRKFDGTAHEEVEGTKCDVGGCPNTAPHNFGEWKICGEHFEMYLLDKLDLDAYFKIKKNKFDGVITDFGELDADRLDNIILEMENEEEGE